MEGGHVVLTAKLLPATPPNLPCSELTRGLLPLHAELGPANFDYQFHFSPIPLTLLHRWTNHLGAYSQPDLEVRPRQDLSCLQAPNVLLPTGMPCPDHLQVPQLLPAAANPVVAAVL